MVYENRVSIEDIKKIQLRSSTGELVYLDGLVNFTKSKALATINHYDRQRQVTVFADLLVMIGFMLLMGMMEKNAVLLVDFANEPIDRWLRKFYEGTIEE